MSVVERICDDFLGNFHREDYFAAKFMGAYYRDWKSNPGKIPQEYSEKFVEDLSKQCRIDHGFGVAFVEGFTSVFRNNPDHNYQGRLRTHCKSIWKKSTDYNYKADPFEHGKKWGQKHLKEMSRKPGATKKKVGVGTGNEPPNVVAGTTDGQERTTEPSDVTAAGPADGQDGTVQPAADASVGGTVPSDGQDGTVQPAADTSVAGTAPADGQDGTVQPAADTSVAGTADGQVRTAEVPADGSGNAVENEEEKLGDESSGRATSEHTAEEEVEVDERKSDEEEQPDGSDDDALLDSLMEDAASDDNKKSEQDEKEQDEDDEDEVSGFIL